mmetsp:Transcript_15012/g.50361  ORF Transcript_15012/g.50361 Transcript_15012/m.50361 type:complete len:229 (+) Transcript_15012:1529-2215(+)
MKPWSISTTPFATFSVNCRSWDTNTTQVEAKVSEHRYSSSQRTAHKSRWFVGSSRMITSPFSSKALAKETRFRSPPERPRTVRFSRWPMFSFSAATARAASTDQPSSTSIFSAALSKRNAAAASEGASSYAKEAASYSRAAVTPGASPLKRTVRTKESASSSSTKGSCSTCAMRSPFRSCTVPSSKVSMPLRIFSRVDLPQPLWPTTATRSPECSVRDAPSRTLRTPL